MSERSLGFEDFQSRVGQSFTMRYATDDSAGAAGACEAVLTECARSPVSGAPRSFNLLFRAGPDAPREQGTYLLSRDDFEPAPIFLVPVRATPDGVEFHAVFNQLTEE
jgi:hypothetical protein